MMDNSNYTDNCSQLFHCNDCDFETHIQSRLSLHRVKKHPRCIDDNIKSINVVVEYPKGKSFYCCICGTIIGSLANFPRHCLTSHTPKYLSIYHVYAPSATPLSTQQKAQEFTSNGHTSYHPHSRSTNHPLNSSYHLWITTTHK